MSLFNWKLIATVIILLGIIAVALSMSPAVSDFFDKVFDRLSGFVPAKEPERNVSFILTADEYNDLKFTNQNINIILNSDNFSAELSTGNITANKNISIIGTRISGYVSGKNIFFEGDFSRIETEGTLISFNTGSIKSNSTFNTLMIDNLKLDKFDMAMASGTIMFDNVMTTIGYKNISIESPLASFMFNSSLHVEGIASKIVAEGIVVG
jgi:hypothetical protein